MAVGRWWGTDMVLQWGRSSAAQNPGLARKQFAAVPGKAVRCSPVHISKKLRLLYKQAHILKILGHSRTFQRMTPRKDSGKPRQVLDEHGATIMRQGKNTYL